MRKYKWLIILTISVLIGAGFRMLTKGGKDKAHSFELAESHFHKEYQGEVSCIGHPKPGAEDYAAVVKGGRLETLEVKVGDEVEKGQILGVINKTDNSAQLRSALSSFRLAQKDYNRIAGLMRSGSATREEFDRVQSNVEVKRAELEQAKQGIEDGMLRASSHGRVSVIVFKKGDRVPDGARVIAVETPGILNLSCRVIANVTARLPQQALVKWKTIVGDRPSVEAPTKIIVPELGDFIGMDREVILISEDERVLDFERLRVQVTMPLKAESNVTQLPSDAVIKRGQIYSVLIKDEDFYEWVDVKILDRDSQTAYVQNLPKGVQALRLDLDLNQIEGIVAKAAKQKNANTNEIEKAH